MITIPLTLLGVVSVLILLFFVVRGYARGAYREFIWAFSLVFASWATPVVVDFVINLVNIFGKFISDRLSSQGNPVTFEVKPDVVAKTIFETFLFLVVATLTYTVGRKKPAPVPGKPTAKPRPPSEKSLLGAGVALLSGIFFCGYIYRNITRIIGGDVRPPVEATITVPSFPGAQIQLSDKKGSYPFLDWLNYLPVILGVILLFFLLFVVLYNPPTNKEGRMDLGRVLVGLVAAAVMLFIGANVFLRR